MKPLFKHNCANCISLGQSQDNTRDLYSCKGTIIARCSDEPSDYESGLYSCNRGYLREAMFNAIILNIYNLDSTIINGMTLREYLQT